MTSTASLWLVAILLASAALKTWRPQRAGSALSTYGVSAPSVQRLTVWLLVSVEAALAATLAIGASWAPAAVAGLFAVFTAITLTAMLAGRGGRPCACFGTDSRLGWSSPARTVALALLAAALALRWLPAAPTAYDSWLTVGLSVGVAAIVALTLAVFALAREVGVLRLGASAAGALEIPEEGPAVGASQEWAASIEGSPRALLRLAIFSSKGCPLCRQVAPAVAHVAADPLLSVRIFDEVSDQETWRHAGVPGSPYAVVLSTDGVALAKGTFNSLNQLESVLATGRFRERGLSVAA